MSPMSPPILAGWLRHAGTEHGAAQLLGPEPGPAGEAGVAVAPGLFIAFDAADTGVVTRVEVDDSADPMDLANLLGASGMKLVGAAPGDVAFLDDPDAALVRRAVSRLALLLLARTVPIERPAPASWGFEALVVASAVADFGFDLSALLATEAAVAAPALVRVLGTGHPMPDAESLVARAAHVAAHALDPLDPAWFELQQAVADLPDLAADILLPALLPVRPRTDDELRRFRGDERPIVLSFPMLWTWVEPDLRPRGDAFDRAITAQFDHRGERVTVRCELFAGAARAVFARLVVRSTQEIVSVFAMLPDGESWQGDGPFDARRGGADLRVEVVGSLGAAVLDDRTLLARVGTQWALLALASERASDLAIAEHRWNRSAERYIEAGMPAKAEKARGRARDCRDGRGNPEMMERRLPFWSELGSEMPADST